MAAGRRVVIAAVEPRPEDRYKSCVPLVPLEAAARAFSDPQHVHDSDWEWLEVDTHHTLRPGMFVNITLKPNNPSFADITLTAESEGRVSVVAEMVEVLG